jgi:signal transduction histidine kinase
MHSTMLDPREDFAMDDHQRFCADVANGLHALAQPLSVLLSSIEMLLLAERSGGNRAHYLDLSAANIRRTCDLFASMQSLVASETLTAQHARVDFSDLLVPVVEERRAIFQDAGVGLVMRLPQGASVLNCDASRTEEAMAAALDAAMHDAQRGDVVEVTASCTDEYGTVKITNSRKRITRLNSTARLHMAVAKANVVSQQGTYRSTEDPFSISFSLRTGSYTAP